MPASAGTSPIISYGGWSTAISPGSLQGSDFAHRLERSCCTPLSGTHGEWYPSQSHAAPGATFQRPEFCSWVYCRASNFLMLFTPKSAMCCWTVTGGSVWRSLPIGCISANSDTRCSHRGSSRCWIASSLAPAPGAEPDDLSYATGCCSSYILGGRGARTSTRHLTRDCEVVWGRRRRRWHHRRGIEPMECSAS